MTTKQAKAAFLKQIKPFVKRFETERKRYETERKRKRKRKHFIFSGPRARQTTEFKASIVLAWRFSAAPGPAFLGIYTDKHRGEMSMIVPILFDLDAEFAPGVVINSEAQFRRLLSLCE
jgi:hypothetical protein